MARPVSEGGTVPHGNIVMLGVVLLLAASGCASNPNDSRELTERKVPEDCEPTGSKRCVAAGLIKCQKVPIETTARSPQDSKAEPALVNVKVVAHLMDADLPGLPADWRNSLHDKTPPRFAPAPAAVSAFWKDALVDPKGPWRIASQIWDGHGIELSLAESEQCGYQPGMLRLDSTRKPSQLCPPEMPLAHACRDSIFFPEDPQTSPWAFQLFRSINKLFTDQDPRAIHVFFWWSLSEEGTGNKYLQKHAYSRSSGRGGPAVWMPTCGCSRSECARVNCANLLAHEIGHALGLHHVEKGDVADPRRNLMDKDYADLHLEDWQKARAQYEARRLNSR